MARLDDLFPDGPPEGLDWDALRELLGDRDLDDLSPDDVRYPAHHEIRARLAELTATVEAGEEAQRQRAAVMRLARAADRDYWTQDKLADAAGVSQAAVSKALAAAPRQPPDMRPAYLAGRLAALAQAAAGDKGRAGRLAEKMLAGTYPVTPASIATLIHLTGQDIRARRRARPVLAEELSQELAEVTALLEPAIHEAVVMTVDNHADMFAGYDTQRRWLKGPAARA